MVVNPPTLHVLGELAESGSLDIKLLGPGGSVNVSGVHFVLATRGTAFAASHSYATEDVAGLLGADKATRLLHDFWVRARKGQDIVPVRGAGFGGCGLPGTDLKALDMFLGKSAGELFPWARGCGDPCRDMCQRYADVRLNFVYSQKVRAPPGT